MKYSRLVFLPFTIALASCSNSTAPNNTEKIYVTLLDNEHITFEKQQIFIKRGTDAEFTFKLEEGYTISNIDYEDYSLKLLGGTSYKLVLNDVDCATRISISLTFETAIRYHANGGKLIDSNEDYYVLNYNFDLHKRLNTSLGNDYLVRDGYTLIGWNTKEDLTGEHIGLGSRTTLSTTSVNDLYASWVKQDRESDFKYIGGKDVVTITSYSGSNETVVIPETIDDKRVVQIESNAFSNNSNIRTVILPKSIKQITSNAFNNCQNLTTLYMYDVIASISNDSFNNCPEFKTLYVNAGQLPCFANATRNRHYADKIDMLILSEDIDKPRMLFMSGSSMWFSLEGKQVDEAFNNEYTIINLAVNSFYAAIPQFEVISHYIKENDVFIHAPEVCSEQELMYSNAMNIRMWTCFELNYDLMSYVDIRKCSEVFSSFVEFNETRAELDQVDYETPADKMWIDEYGCIPFIRPQVNGDEDLLDGARIGTDLLTNEAFSRLNYYYDLFASKTKNKTLFAYGPINYDGLPEDERNEDIWKEFEVRCEENLTNNAVIINTLESSIFKGRYFYQTNYHLGTEASKIWTLTLTDGIKEALSK